ncbi:MmpS family transport accessory protein [Lentzea sp. NPDC004782]|uniref:MmpS family transport accessory protein n=1 Tax=Lentzea sp. NPDC004782 TaxID=3154458 RepID=UPI0033A33EF7
MPSATNTRKAGPPAPPTGRGHRRAWWAAAAGLTAAVVVAAGVLSLTDNDAAPVPTTHTIVYEVTGPGGRAPEIRFAGEGTNSVEKAEAVGLPWRKELTIPAGPGLAVAQVMATNGQGESISCTITVDGHVVANNTAKGEYTTVSCSNMITPPARG